MDSERVEFTRGYLAEWLRDEAEWDEDDRSRAEWFVGLSEDLQGLPLIDPRLARATEYLQPFVDDDPHIDTAMGGTAMYDSGAFVRETERGGGDFDGYIDRMVDALGRDHAQWLRLLAGQGDEFEWEPSALTCDPCRQTPVSAMSRTATASPAAGARRSPERDGD